MKPFFTDAQAHVPIQDRDKSAARKLYERVITGVSKLLKNPPRQEVATEIHISRRLDDPKTGTVQAILQPIPSALGKAPPTAA